MVNIYSTFVEDIEKAFRGHLPQHCINILARMSEENRELQNAVNKQQELVMKMMQFIVMSDEYKKLLNKDIDKFNKDFADPYKDIVKSQDLKED